MNEKWIKMSDKLPDIYLGEVLSGRWEKRLVNDEYFFQCDITKVEKDNPDLYIKDSICMIPYSVKNNSYWMDIHKDEWISFDPTKYGEWMEEPILVKLYSGTVFVADINNEIHFTPTFCWGRYGYVPNIEFVRKLPAYPELKNKGE